MSKSKKTFYNVSTKIPFEYRERLTRIAEAFGMNCYSILQALLYSLVAYTDKNMPLTFEHIAMLKTFCPQFITGERNPLGAKNTEVKNVTGAIIFCEYPNHVQPVYVSIDEKGKHVETLNHDTMLDALLGAIAPDILQQLQTEKCQQRNFSTTQTLREVVTESYPPQQDTIAYEIAEMFKDVRIPTGHKTNEDIFYKRKQNRGGFSQITQLKEHYRADI